MRDQLIPEFAQVHCHLNSQIVDFDLGGHFPVSESDSGMLEALIERYLAISKHPPAHSSTTIQNKW